MYVRKECSFSKEVIFVCCAIKVEDVRRLWLSFSLMAMTDEPLTNRETIRNFDIVFFRFLVQIILVCNKLFT